jgi:hypothetical protein
MRVGVKEQSPGEGVQKKGFAWTGRIRRNDMTVRTELQFERMWFVSAPSCNHMR